MLTKRIIPCLDVRDGRVVKGIRFSGLRDAGDPTALASSYEQQGADELVMLDVSATSEGRATALETVRAIRAVISIPLTVGGGVRSVEHAQQLLEAGADKVAVNTAATDRPLILRELSQRFGTQCTVVAIDAARRVVMPQGAAGAPPTWQVVIRSGTVRLDLDAVEWACSAESLGAGEVLLTSWDRDGTRSGYDLDLLTAVSGAVRMPVIASGGAASAEHLIEALNAGADAVLAASMFHDGQFTVADIKHSLARAGVPVRMTSMEGST